MGQNSMQIMELSGSLLSAIQHTNIKKKGTYEDGEGLRLVVKPNGKKSWIFRYQINGRRREMGLGPFPVVGLREARTKALDQRRLIFDGIDPLESKREHKEKILREARKEVTFEELASQYIQDHSSSWTNEKHRKQWESSLQTYTYPTIGKLRIDTIQTQHIVKVLKPIWIEKHETARRVRNRIELILDAAKAKGLREGDNPAAWKGHLETLLPKDSQPKRHHTALPWEELPEFIKTIHKQSGLAFRAMELTILSACRTNEVLSATWDEIDLKSNVWTIPTNRTKTKKEHRVPISKPMNAILNQLKNEYGNQKYLFPGQKEGRPLSNMSMLMALRRINRDDLTMHGFRSTFRDWAGENTTHPREICEQALAHSVGNAVENAYRRGDLFKKRTVLMEDWADYIYDS